MARRTLIVAVLGLLALTPAWAIEKGQWEIALGPDFHLFDNGTGADNDVGGRLRLGWQFADKVGAELAIQQVDASDDFGESENVDVTEQLAALNLIWSIGAQDFQPFVLLGLGWVDMELESTGTPCGAGGTSGCLPKDFGAIQISQVTGGERVTTLDDSGLLWQAGLGARFPIGRRVGFRVQAVASRIDVFNESFTNITAGVDISILWGQPK